MTSKLVDWSARGPGDKERARRLKAPRDGQAEGAAPAWSPQVEQRSLRETPHKAPQVEQRVGREAPHKAPQAERRVGLEAPHKAAQMLSRKGELPLRNRELVLRNRLKEARREMALSQGRLAEMVGVSRQTISSIETGQFSPTARLALLLCYALERRFEDLFFFEEGEES